MRDDDHGTILTFYSYKGGSGRSMAVANVAWILASNGKRVLVIDWDLEAPGLHRYFAPFLQDNQLRTSDGVLEFVMNFALEAMTPLPDRGQDPSTWYIHLANIQQYAVSLEYPFPTPGGIDFVPAGRQDSSYAKHVSSFNWINFYERLGGGVFLEAAKSRMCKEYDYILIDSRTGVSDTSGICTVQLPDSLIVCVTPNNQNIQGGSAVATSVRKLWLMDPSRAQKPNTIFPVLTRVDPFELHKLQRLQEYARIEFSACLGHLTSSEQARYWQDMVIPYIPFYGYEEVLAVFGDKPSQATSLLSPMEQLTRYVTGGAVERLIEPPTEAKRAEILKQYSSFLRDSSTETSTIRSDRTIDVFVAYERKDLEAANKLTSRLQNEGFVTWFDQEDLIPGDRWDEKIDAALRMSTSCAILIGSDDSPLRWQKSLWETIERRAGLDTSFRLIPVILPEVESPDRLKLPVSLATATYVTFKGSIDDAQAFHRLTSGIRGIAPGPETAGVQQGQPPYRSLQPFELDHASLFFGREALITDMLERIHSFLTERKRRLITLVGSSGIGKSSLLRAGLHAQLRRDAITGSALWPVLYVRPGSDPLESLAVILTSLPEIRQNLSQARELVTAMQEDSKTLHLTVRLALSKVPAERRLLLLIDPYDEIFTLCQDEGRRSNFEDNLSYAIDANDGQTIVAIGLRSHFYGEYLTHSKIGNGDTCLTVGHLSLEGLLRAIEEPAHIVGLSIEKGLIPLLLNGLEGQAAVLPLLQCVLAELWTARDGNMLTIARYKELGEIRGIIQRLYETAYRALSDADQEVARQILLTLVNPWEVPAIAR